VQLAGFGYQTPANDGAELIEDTRFHGVLARELSAWFARAAATGWNVTPRSGLREGKFLCAADKLRPSISSFNQGSGR
jgi:hypothetical protein